MTANMEHEHNCSTHYHAHAKCDCRAKVIGVCWDAENAKTLTVIWDKVPTDNDLRRTHDLLRFIAQVTGSPASSASSRGMMG